jgi:hypothetical protein
VSQITEAKLFEWLGRSYAQNQANAEEIAQLTLALTQKPPEPPPPPPRKR